MGEVRPCGWLVEVANQRRERNHISQRSAGISSTWWRPDPFPPPPPAMSVEEKFSIECCVLAVTNMRSAIFTQVQISQMS